MLASQRYRDRAMACLLAAKKEPKPYRQELQLSLAACWLKLANQDEAVSKMIENWGNTEGGNIN